MNRFEAEMSGWFNHAKTRNNANAYKSTKNEMVDFFSNAGAMRNSSPDEIKELFDEALRMDTKMAIVLMFYFRDVRGGQGERRVFRECFKQLIEYLPALAKAVLELIPEYGRWDDIFVARDTDLHDQMLYIINKQFVKDVFALDKKESISLLAKWLPTERRHGKRDRFALEIADYIGISPRKYRKLCTAMRKQIGVVESLMSANKWQQIEFDKIPSQAMKKYYATFFRKMENEFNEYLAKVNRGEKQIKTATLYPYQVIEPLMDWYRSVNNNELKAIETMWSQLPEYFEGKNNTLIMADTSASMYGQPMAMAASLAIYCSERNTGYYKNKFMSFSAKPQFVELKDSMTIQQKARKIMSTDWGMNTNLEKAFENILQIALNSQAKQEELPQRIIVISDMQFDQATGKRNEWGHEVSEDYVTLKSGLEQRYLEHGYAMPKLVFWNVNATKATCPMKEDERGLMVSGASPEIMKSVLKDEFIAPMDIVLDVISRKRYEPVLEKLQSF